MTLQMRRKWPPVSLRMFSTLTTITKKVIDEGRWLGSAMCQETTAKREHEKDP